MSVAAAVLAVAAAGAPPAAPLAPVGPWVVRADENLCLLSRTFGEGDAQIAVGFQPLFYAENMDLLVSTKGRQAESSLGDGSIAFEGAPAIRGRYVAASVPKKNLRFYRMTVPYGAWEQLKGAPSLSLKLGPVRATVQLVRVGKAMGPFDECQRDLLRSWGVDPAIVVGDRHPRPRNIGSAFSSDAYPPAALRNGTYGRVVAIVQVDAGGGVTACHVVASAGKELNDGTCEAAKRLRFDPATNDQGQAVPSVYVLPVKWLLPGTRL